MDKIAHKIEEKERTVDIQLKEKVPFSKMLLSNCVRKGLHEAGFIYPTNIQANTIPLGKAGIDLLIHSKSGTGKTLIFSCVILEAYRSDIRQPQSLILAPTREVAVQIESVINNIGRFCQGFSVISVIGGLNVTADRKKVQKAKAIVGTPGRVLHLIKNEVLNTAKISLVILDEADKMMDETFHEDIENIIKSLPSGKQVIACSATLNDNLDTELAKYMINPLLVSMEKRSALLVGIKQFVYELPEEKNPDLEMKAKLTSLKKMFSKISFKQCLIFVEYQFRGESCKSVLTEDGWPCEFISGSQDQKTRLKIFKKFREFEARILISTDLMSRGIDLENVNLVVNLDVPKSGPTYLHRIGRAGRFGSHGIAITFLSSTENKVKFCEVLKEVGEEMIVFKLPAEEIPDLWTFSNLNVDQKTFELFEVIEMEENYSKLVKNSDAVVNNVQNCEDKDVDNLKPTDSCSSSSQKQLSVNATTLDDASSLAVDSDIHLDIPNTAPSHNNFEKKISSTKKLTKSKKRGKNLLEEENGCIEDDFLVKIEMNNIQQKIVEKETEEVMKNNKLEENEVLEPSLENKTKSNEENNDCNQSDDVGNSSGGDTRTIIDFKSLVIDKMKEAPGPSSNNIFVDYLSFREIPSENDSKKEGENTSSSSCKIFDDYIAHRKSELTKENNNKNNVKELQTLKEEQSIPPTSLLNEVQTTQNTSTLDSCTAKKKDNSIVSVDLPKAPHPSPKDLNTETIERISDFRPIEQNNQQSNTNKLQIQNLPSFNLPPRNNSPELNTSEDGADGDNYSSSSFSSEQDIRSSGFDEKTSSNTPSSGIVTSTTDYYESEESVYVGDTDSCGTTPCCSNSVSESAEEYSSTKESENVEQGAEKNPSVYQPEIEININYRYQHAYDTWMNMYWNQLTEIRDYVRFCEHVKENANKK